MAQLTTTTGTRTKRAARRFLVCVAWLLVAGPVAASTGPAPLPPPVAAALKQAGLSARGFSAYVQVIGESEPRLAFNADVPRNPASSVKVLTTLASIETLGPAYAWKTEAYAVGPVRDGRLQGDLYLKGYGDPFLVAEHFWRFLRALRTNGIDEISGDLVLDQSHFAPAAGDPADFDGRPSRAYNVPPLALLVNFQGVRFHLSPEPDLKRVRVTADPHPANLEIVNRIKLVSGPCREGVRRIGVQGQVNGRERAVLSGRYAAACGDGEIIRVAMEPAVYIQGVFQAYWRELGGRFDGGVREGQAPEGALLLYAQESPPLSDIVRSINKYSNNVMTRQLLLTLGARESPPGTEEKGIAAVRRWLSSRSLDFPELVLENGSGLSREERISARHLGEVLLAGYASPFMPEFLSSLPISAMDGTLRRRFGGTPLEGRLHLKTGSLDAVRSMAGYLLDGRGRRVVVVSLHNDDRLHAAGGERVQEALLGWAYDLP